MAFIDDLRVYRDKLRFRIYKALYDYKAVKSGNDFNFSSIQHIVISKIDGKLGDTQVMTPFFANIKKHYPHIKISVITLANVKDIYEQCIGVDTTLIAPQKRPSKAQVLAMAEKIGVNGKCDLFIFLDEVVRPREFYMLHYLKPDYVAATAKGLDCVNIPISIDYSRHMSQALNSLLSLGGIKDIDDSYISFASDLLISKYREVFKGSKVIGFTPYGAMSCKNITQKMQEQMLDYILEHTDYKIVMLLAPSAVNYKHKIETKLGDRCIALPDHITVIELSSVIACLDALVSVDTANVHIAGAFDIPLFSLHPSKANITLWGPHHAMTHSVKFSKEGVYISDLCYADIKEDFEAFIDRYCR
ncbi:lipopolysaccharide core biosynthesis protein [Anaerobiospirillum thomasii]|uniref:Lipopolysaccharide core biosynthesis protein n=1 Tax=Anaerobiospirillum thomasii TaxID=179995 RepID=A0A2X0V2Q0_9GAMM|nr:glycosyltransferase family 9 protein [Anaerobiospirillum thomasii]SPT68638.1 lipopolysaccharide core biosynthesis protein [Anaerobiospirillum thomasii]SPT68819.1 lipopolysaccharide core biosynthesis protein [Anaerobiospirillum thomasii]